MNNKTILFLFAILTAMPLWADSFLTVSDLPNGVKFLPAPPDTVSLRYVNDWNMYLQGKKLRTGERGTQAKKDDIMSAAGICSNFSGAFGTKLSKSKTPEIYALLAGVVADGMNAVASTQEHYMRKAPFTQFKENTMLVTNDANLAQKGSYASAHACVGWAVGLILAEINIDRQDTILSRAYQYGESRVIVGARYESDVDAGRVLATGAVARLHADEAFMEQLQKAKDEYQGILDGVTSVEATTEEESDEYYDINGMRIDGPRQGLYIYNKQKILGR